MNGKLLLLVSQCIDWFGACNQKRGHTAPSQFAEQCRNERGLEPNVGVVADQLDRLTAAIAAEGGMRKIRDYVSREARPASVSVALCQPISRCSARATLPPSTSASS